MEKSASQARIFDSNERSILNKTTIKSGTVGWNGVAAHSTDIRTCDLEIPRGHATVKCGELVFESCRGKSAEGEAGKYFEVRYFLNIIVHSSHRYAARFPPPDILKPMLTTPPKQQSHLRPAAHRPDPHGEPAQTNPPSTPAHPHPATELARHRPQLRRPSRRRHRREAPSPPAPAPPPSPPPPSTPTRPAPDPHPLLLRLPPPRPAHPPPPTPPPHPNPPALAVPLAPRPRLRRALHTITRAGPRRGRRAAAPRARAGSLAAPTAAGDPARAEQLRVPHPAVEPEGKGVARRRCRGDTQEVVEACAEQ